MRPYVALVIVVAMIVLSLPGAAFNPPEDKAGPLQVRIEGPAKVAALDTPAPYRIVVRNAGDSVVEGKVRVQVIDHWRVEPSELPFHVDANATTELNFNAVIGKGTYNALYPIHAFVEFESGGVRYAPHPVLIVETQLPEVPRVSVSVPWQPLPVAADSSLCLLRSPVYRVLIAVFAEKPVVTESGWRGSDGRTRTSVDPAMRLARGDAREALGIHPPWYEGRVGAAIVEYPLNLPACAPITLRFGNAIRDTLPTEPSSDGVLFRVRALPLDAPDGEFGEILYEKFTDAKTWQDGEADLSRFAGKSIRLQVESHPGPKHDPTCDQSYWADLTLTAGTPKPAAASLGEEKVLGRIRHDGVSYDVAARLGARGLLDGEIAFVAGEKRLAFRGFHVVVQGERLDAPSGATELVNVADESEGGVYRVRHRFRNWRGPFDVLAELRAEPDTGLSVRFALENAPKPEAWCVTYIEDVAAGPWSQHAAQVYAGVGNVLREPEAFELGFDGHQLSTSFAGFDFVNGVSVVQAVDVPPSKLEVTPSDKRYTIHAPLNVTMYFIPRANVWDAVRTWRGLDPRAAAGGVETLAGRFVFDLWGGHYKPSTAALNRAFRYGLTDSAVVWHNWQRWGYDYRLPDIYPPNPDFGTLDEFQALAKTCKERGVPFAPHDNYIDLYPDAEGFTYDNVSFSREAQPVRGWLNEGRGAQAFRWRTDAYRPFMERNLKLIRDAIAPTAYFIDVFSSIGPYESWTYDGQFQDRLFTRDTWGKTFAWIRDCLGNNAPQISESGHDQLIGYLDGGQCNHLRVDANPPGKSEWFVWRLKCADAERIPWIDMAYHDRFALHGAGYESRFRGGLDREVHGIYGDDYLATEALTGHPAMAPEPFSRNVVRKYWLLHDLMRALARRRIDKVEFDGDNLHRQHVTWDNGHVWVNRGSDDWSAAGHTLPQYGFYAKVDQAEAAIERIGGVIVEWSRSPDAYYVNARSWMSNKQPVSVKATSLRLLEGRKFELKLAWEADRPLQESVNLFAHLVDNEGKIRFQADLNPPKPTTEWRGEVETVSGGEIPPDIPAGQSFDLRVGLWRPDLGRLPLSGPMDDESRVRLGAVRLDGEASNITGLTWQPLEAAPEPDADRWNRGAKPIDFVGACTNGACRIAIQDRDLVVTPLPEMPVFKAVLSADAIHAQTSEFKTLEALSEDGSVIRSAPLTLDKDAIVIECEPGVFAYRLTKRVP